MHRGQTGGAGQVGAEVWKACTCLWPSRSQAGSSQEPQSGQAWADAAMCPGRCGAPSVCPSVPRWTPESCRCWPCQAVTRKPLPNKKDLD